MEIYERTLGGVPVVDIIRGAVEENKEGLNAIFLSLSKVTPEHFMGKTAAELSISVAVASLMYIKTALSPNKGAFDVFINNIMPTIVDTTALVENDKKDELKQ